MRASFFPNGRRLQRKALPKYRGGRQTLGIAAIGVLAVLAGCGNPSSAPQPLASVAPLPAPSIPAWISEIAPQGAVKNRAQIRVIFSSPVLPVEQLGSTRERDILSHFQIAPSLPGEFVVLTPRMIAFQTGNELPSSTRIRITVTAGLQDLEQHRLDRDLAWTFATPRLRLNLPQGEPAPRTVSLKPVIHVTANTRFNVATFMQHAAFISASAGSVRANAALESPQPGSDSIVYDVSPQGSLQRGMPYRLVVDPGVMPESGNLPSDAALEVPMSTYSALAFATAQPTADPLTSSGQPRFANGDVALVFNNALNQKTFQQHVSVSPSPQQVGQLYSLSDDGKSVLVNPYALQPQTAYTFTFDPGLQDVYGQRLGRTESVTYSTPDYAPYFWAPSGSNMFLASQRLKLQFSAINLPGNRYRAQYRAIDSQMLASSDPGNAQDVLPSPAAWPAFSFDAARNHQSTIEIPLREKLGGPAGVLAYGAGAATAQPMNYFGVVQLTNLGIFTQWFPQSGSIMVQHLSDGSPVSRARVEVYASHLYEPQAEPALLCASGSTDPQGVITVAGTDVERCYIGNRPADQAPQLYVVARSGSDWAYVRSFEWSGVYTYASQIGDATWSAGQPITRGTIFSDREMYQPGDRGWFTAVCYVLQNGVLHADRSTKYSLRLTDPDGHETKLPAQTTGNFATFAFPIDFAKSQPAGYYTVVATSPDGAQITGSFRVAEFRPPNFSVDLKLNRDVAAAGGNVTAQGNAHYLFGAPMSGTAVMHVTRERTFFTPKGWDDFTFGRQWFWPEQEPDVSADAGQQSLALDAQGNTTGQINVERTVPFAMTYRVDLEATDVSHLSTSATQNFTALPSSTLIGLRSDFVGTVNSPIEMSVIVTDAQGRPQPGTRVHVELQRLEYSGVTQIVEGSEASRNQVRYSTVAQADVSSADRAQNVTLQTKDPGSYRIHAIVAGSSDNATATDTQVWVTGPGQAAWGEENPTQLQLKLDRRSYSPGDVATVAVASPYDKADLYLSVVRDRVLYKTLLHVNGSAPRVRVPILQAMFPNAGVQGVLVRRGAPVSAKNAAGVDSLVRIGMVPLSLDLRPQYLTVKIMPEHLKAAPHAHQRIHLHVTDARGKAVRGQFTVIVANDAILQLSGYRPPDLVKIVLRDQPISTRFADNRPDVTLIQPSDVAQKGWGYGGGFLAGAAGTRVRTQFVPLAYFNGAVRTDASGSADVSFTTPDNLTTWRVMAVAFTADARPRFGNADATFITTKPLVTDPLLPQFARPGDRFDAGLSLMNSTGAPLDARTQAVLSGVLTFTQPAATQLEAQQSFGTGMNAWRFPIRVTGPGGAALQFHTVAANESDAFKVPLDVRTADVSESTIEAGATDGQTSVPLQIGSGAGSVYVVVAGSLIPQVAQAAKGAMNADRLSLLTPVAARLSIASSVLALQAKLRQRVAAIDASSEVRVDVAQLGALQRSDGGFGFWPFAGASDPLGSAQAVRVLVYARDNGVSVPNAILVKAKPYLVRALADPAGAAKWCTSDNCKASVRLAMLQALAALGDRRTDFLQNIYLQREGLGLTERVNLALYLQQTPGWRLQANTAAAEVSQEIYLTGRYANVQPEGSWYGSPVEAQAAYLRLLTIRDASSEMQDRALRALVEQQCKCGWPSAIDTAAALEAIVAYSARQRTMPRFTAELSADGKRFGDARFDGFSAPDRTFTLSSLAAGTHTIVLRKTGAGTLHYLVSYEYQLEAKAPGRLAGLRVRRTVRVANAASALATIDIPPQEQPLAFKPGNVYDIGVEIIADHPVDRVVVTDPLPAGFEALDTSFQTTAAYYQPLTTDWQIDYQQIYRDRIVAFAQHLNPGVYAFHYLARSVTPGSYLWPGTSAYLLDAPEQFGRSAFATVDVGS